jgi:hypothetical protein
MANPGFAFFIDQQEQFKKALVKRDPNVWFPPLRGSWKEDDPSNWFLPFVPGTWGQWNGAVYGVHFDMIYAKAKDHFRLCVGVENPMKYSYRQSFKENVISRINKAGIAQSGFSLIAKDRAKLLEADPIPFIPQSWQIIMERYISLQSVVAVIGDVAKEYYDHAAFDVYMDFAP